jgi:outer membrane receptor protein involved in Fe transport
MQSPYFLHDVSVGRNGTPVSTNIADGYYSNSRAFGMEAAFDLADDWKFDDKFRIAATSGRFVGPYPAEVNTASALAAEIGGAGATLGYATGPRAGQAITDPNALGGNGLAVLTALFNTTLNNLGNFSNDMQFTKGFELEEFGAANMTLGYFYAWQIIDEDWHWNEYLEEVQGKDAALLNVFNASGGAVTQNGLVAYGEPLYFGNCCVRSYRLRYDTDAPYLALNWQKGPFNVDGSLRDDIARASGTYAGSTGTVAYDVNGDGVIETPEKTVPMVNNADSSPVDYTVRYFSYSFGGNYLLNPDLALFARVSEGGRANAERLLFGGGVNASGGVAQPVAVDTVKQYETGVKWRGDYTSIFATFFRATTQVTDQNITSITAEFTSRTYRADGLELEGAWSFGGFSLRGGATYTLGKIIRDGITPQDIGAQINPHFMYQFTPAYHWDKLKFGLNFIGTTVYPAVGGGINNPGFVQVNAFASYELAKGLTVSVTGNNLFNQIGITEIPNASAGITANGVNTARSINGRTLIASLVYAF